jgi:hypothetical protein
MDGLARVKDIHDADDKCRKNKETEYGRDNVIKR